MIGWLAASRAGHDKGRIYLITGREGDSLLLCDGRYRPVANPKKKKEKHIQIIKKTVHRELQESLRAGIIPRDEEIKALIKEYAKQMEETHVKE